MSFEIKYNPSELTELDLNDRNHEIRNLLHKHVCEVTFTKLDGSVRTMPCTLMESAMPARDANKFHQTRPYKPETLSVFCTDKSEWRSFRVANVTEVRVVDGQDK
jgi:hypothetical protein